MDTPMGNTKSFSNQNMILKPTSRDAVTQTQLSALLGTAATLNGILQSMVAVDGGNEMGGRNDGGVRAAVETSLANALHRIDILLDDSQRWGMEHQNALEEAIIGAHKSIQALNEVAVAPHTRFRPQLAQLTDGSWIAFLGDKDDLANALVGAGDSPKAALKAFDMVFNNEIPQHLMQWIKQDTENEKQTLDRNGTDTNTGDAGPENSSEGNSPEVGPER